MRRRDRYKHLLNLCANFVMLVMEAAMFALVWYQLYVPNLPKEDQFWRRGNWAVIGIYAMILFFFIRTFGGYRIGYLRISDICLSQILGILFANIIEYIQICMIANDYVNVGPIFLLTVAEIALILPGVFVVRYFYVRLYPPRKMIVIYGEHSPDELIKKINSRRDKYDVCATASAYMGYEALYTKILEYEAVVLCDLPTEIRNKILKFCYDQNKRTYITPKISDIIITGTERLHLFDTPLMLSRNQGLTIEQRFIKRTMDIVFSLAAIVITSPILLLIAIAIKCYDRGPVFYTQERLTRDREPFQIIKFRSMKVDSEASGAQLAKKDDDRITPVGKFIRRTHLDELPQIFNILKGDMSIVGPRPALWNQDDLIAERDKYGANDVMPGLTGWAQINGRDELEIPVKAAFDGEYVKKFGFAMDVRCFFGTFLSVLRGDGVVEGGTGSMEKKKGDCENK